MEPGNRNSQNTPTGWENQRNERSSSPGSAGPYRDRNSKESQGGYSGWESKDSQRDRIERFNSVQSKSTHNRQNSANTGYMSQGPMHDYDVQAMESDLYSMRGGLSTRNPIPPPTVTVRSEFPTLSRLKQSQIVTCLVTVEVPDNKWVPDPEDIRGAPAFSNTHHQEKEVTTGPRNPEERPGWSAPTPPEDLEEVTEELRARVENWHGLEFSR